MAEDNDKEKQKLGNLLRRMTDYARGHPSARFMRVPPLQGDISGTLDGLQQGERLNFLVPVDEEGLSEDGVLKPGSEVAAMRRELGLSSRVSEADDHPWVAFEIPPGMSKAIEALSRQEGKYTENAQMVMRQAQENAPFAAPYFFDLKSINGSLSAGLLERGSDSLLFYRTRSNDFAKIQNVLADAGLIDKNHVNKNALIRQKDDGSGHWMGIVRIPSALAAAIRRGYSEQRVVAMQAQPQLMDSSRPLEDYLTLADTLEPLPVMTAASRKKKEKSAPQQSADAAGPKTPLQSLEQLSQSVSPDAVKLWRQRRGDGGYDYYMQAAAQQVPQGWLENISSDTVCSDPVRLGMQVYGAPLLISRENYERLGQFFAPQAQDIPWKFPVEKLTTRANQHKPGLNHRVTHFIVGPKDAQGNAQAWLVASTPELAAQVAAGLLSGGQGEAVTGSHEEPAVMRFSMDAQLVADLRATRFFDKVEQPDDFVVHAAKPVFLDWYDQGAPQEAAADMEGWLRGALQIRERSASGTSAANTPRPTPSGRSKASPKSGWQREQAAERVRANALKKLLSEDGVLPDVEEPVALAFKRHHREGENGGTYTWVEPVLLLAARSGKDANALARRAQAKEYALPPATTDAKADHSGMLKIGNVNYRLYECPLSPELLKMLQEEDVLSGFSLLKPDGRLERDLRAGHLFGDDEHADLFETLTEGYHDFSFAPTQSPARRFGERLQAEITQEAAEEQIDPVERGLRQMSKRNLVVAQVKYPPQQTYQTAVKAAEAMGRRMQAAKRYEKQLDKLQRLTDSILYPQDAATSVAQATASMPALSASLASLHERIHDIRSHSEQLKSQVKEHLTHRGSQTRMADEIKAEATFASSLGPKREATHLYIRNAGEKLFDHLKALAKGPEYMYRPPEFLPHEGPGGESLILCYPTPYLMHELEQRGAAQNMSQLSDEAVALKPVLAQVREHIRPETKEEKQQRLQRGEVLHTTLQKVERRLSAGPAPFAVKLRQEEGYQGRHPLKEERIGTQYALIFPLSDDRIRRGAELQTVDALAQQFSEAQMTDTIRYYRGVKELTAQELPPQVQQLKRLDEMEVQVDEMAETLRRFTYGRSESFPGLHQIWDGGGLKDGMPEPQEAARLLKGMLKARAELAAQLQSLCDEGLPLSFDWEEMSAEGLEPLFRLSEKGPQEYRRICETVLEEMEEAAAKLAAPEEALEAEWGENNYRYYRRLTDEPETVVVRDSGCSLAGRDGLPVMMASVLNQREQSFAGREKAREAKRENPAHDYAVLYVSKDAYKLFTSHGGAKLVDTVGGRGERDDQQRELAKEHRPLSAPEMPHLLSEWAPALDALLNARGKSVAA